MACKIKIQKCTNFAHVYFFFIFDCFQIFSNVLCGQNKRYLMKFTSTIVEIHFYSDASTNGAGFNITYHQEDGKSTMVLHCVDFFLFPELIYKRIYPVYSGLPLFTYRIIGYYNNLKTIRKHAYLNI